MLINRKTGWEKYISELTFPEMPEDNEAKGLSLALAVINHHADRDEASCIIVDGHESIAAAFEVVTMLEDAVSNLKATFVSITLEQIEWHKSELEALTGEASESKNPLVIFGTDSHKITPDERAMAEKLYGECKAELANIETDLKTLAQMRRDLGRKHSNTCAKIHVLKQVVEVKA